MYIKQSELLWGLDREFIQHFIEGAVKASHPKGFVLFNEGEPADNFYILVKGGIRLSLGEKNKTTYLVNHAGEAFGWSSLAGMPIYTASAECLHKTVTMRFTKEFINNLTESNPKNGMAFYRRLAKMLGNRLVRASHLEPETVSEGLELSFGTGQNIESYTTP